MQLSYYYYSVIVLLLITHEFWSAWIFNDIAINIKKLHEPKQDYMKTARFNVWTYTFEMEEYSAWSYDKALEWKEVYDTFYYTCKSESLAIVFNFYFASITIFIPFL